MGDTSVFNALSSKLSVEERQELLARIRQGAALSAEPLISPDAFPGRGTRNPQARLEELGIFARILLFFRRLFSGKTNEELFLEDELRDLARSVDSLHPGLIDARRGLLLEGFAAQLRILRDSARFFVDVLARSVEKDKGAFIAFLASIEIPEIHARLLAETDPFERTSSHSTSAEIRATILESWEDILLSLTEDKRRAMYGDLRSLVFLKRLSGFLFDRLLGLFRPLPDGAPAAAFQDARELLLELGDLLVSVSDPPSSELLEALFVMAAREEWGDPAYDPEAALGKDLAMVAEALQGIRTFNARVPLGTILRLVAEDPEYLPRELPGSEDWFAIFKSFWKERIETRLEEYRTESRVRELAADISQFTGNAEPADFPHLSSAGGEGFPPCRFEVALSFLEGFQTGPFTKEMNRPLKILLIEGDFYRKDNRIEFTDAYDELLRLHENLATLDARFSPDGEIGRAWNQASNEMLTIAFKRRKLDAIRRGAEDEAEALVRRVGETLHTLARVIKGILKGEAGGRYDSLQNLSTLDGRSNREFLRTLELVRARCDKALLLLSELSGLDLGKIE